MRCWKKSVIQCVQGVWDNNFFLRRHGVIIDIFRVRFEIAALGFALPQFLIIKFLFFFFQFVNHAINWLGHYYCGTVISQIHIK